MHIYFLPLYTAFEIQLVRSLTGQQAVLEAMNTEIQNQRQLLNTLVGQKDFQPLLDFPVQDESQIEGIEQKLRDKDVFSNLV